MIASDWANIRATLLGNSASETRTQIRGGKWIKLFFYPMQLFNDTSEHFYTVPVPPGPPKSASISKMSPCRGFLSFFFFFLEGSSGGFSRDSSSGLLMSEMERTGESRRDQEGRGKKFSPPFRHLRMPRRLCFCHLCVTVCVLVLWRGGSRARNWSIVLKLLHFRP